TNYFDGCQIFFDDSGSSYTVNLAAAVSPYQLSFSSILHDYFITGSGSIVGPGGLTKQGSGKLSLAVSNNYTGDTMISGGTIALEAKGAIPGGPGQGNTILNGTLDLGGFDCILNNLSGNGTLDNA